MTNICKEISEKLNISVHTINRHRQNILEKTHADNVEAIAFAKRMRVIG
nr:LuxR C-terminal-related transcriptional regulator [uncultured Capnocytophaga sp.]